MLCIDRGLKIGLITLELLRNIEEFKEIDIGVGTFTNCRECGLTFRVWSKSLKGHCFTFCVYEHRNSDQIIINGKKGCIDMAGDLPYKGDSSSAYLASFPCGEYDKAADKLAELILEKAK